MELAARKLSYTNVSTSDTVMFVIAHPDDEAMFFGPTILALRSSHVATHILCLSTGNADGKGSSRIAELKRSCQEFQIDPAENLEIVDHPGLQVVTFDEHGISGHPNHCSVCKGVLACMKRAQDLKEEFPEVFTLRSVGIVRKFCWWADIIPTMLECWLSVVLPSYLARMDACYINLSPFIIYKAMRAHRSQWLWFRKLFVMFSRYTFVNTLTRCKLDGQNLAAKDR